MLFESVLVLVLSVVTVLPRRGPICACGKTCVFGLPSGKPTHCGSCKSADMINLKERKCFCGKARAGYARPGDKATHCVLCKSPDMVDVVSKKCECGKNRPMYGVPDGKAICCALCKTAEMISVIGKKCLCGKSRPSYNLPGEFAKCCASCKTDNMIDVVHHLCECGTVPTYGVEGGRATHCRRCKTSDMITIIGKICKSEMCDVRVNNKYDGYCLRCYINLFPDKPVSQKIKIKEQHVVAHVKQLQKDFAYFKEATISYDQIVDQGCSRRRPDICVEFLTHTIIIECDEDQHNSEKYCSCENKRIMQLFQDLGSRPIVALRFNPDAWTDRDGKKIKSCFKYHKSQGVPLIEDREGWQKRLAVLTSRLEFYCNNVPERAVTTEHLFYDNFM